MMNASELLRHPLGGLVQLGHRFENRLAVLIPVGQFVIDFPHAGIVRADIGCHALRQIVQIVERFFGSLFVFFVPRIFW